MSAVTNNRLWTLLIFGNMTVPQGQDFKMDLLETNCVEILKDAGIDADRASLKIQQMGGPPGNPNQLRLQVGFFAQISDTFDCRLWQIEVARHLSCLGQRDASPNAVNVLIFSNSIPADTNSNRLPATGGLSRRQISQNFPI